MEQKLEFIDKGRCGSIIYKDEKGEIKVSYEFGGTSVLVFIFIPTIEEWEIKTSRPLIDRSRILTFIAEQSIKEKASNCSYNIKEDYIEIIQTSTINL